MTQFAVFPNPRRDGMAAYVVQIQTTRFDHTKGRVVMTLIRRTANAPPDHPITPYLTVLDTPVFANPFDIATVPVRSLGSPLMILPEADQGRIITAIDELIARA